MAGDTRIRRLDIWSVRIPLARPYRLSANYGTLTHSQAVLLRLELEGGAEGWGECDPHESFDGYTLDRAMAEVAGQGAALIGADVAEWVSRERGAGRNGAPAAAIDVACHDALGRVRGEPLWRLLGDRRRSGIDALWPTSNGDAEADLAIIAEKRAEGFRTFMLKMGDQPIKAEIARSRAVIARAPADVRIMVDANQGWRFDEALAYVEACDDLPIVLVEQPLAAGDLSGLAALREATRLPISVDESILRADQAGEILRAGAADVFSIKVSKNGGLANSRAIAREAAAAGKRVLMNSMIELGVTQAASLHLGLTLDRLTPCGHAYMSTLRMADDVTDFSAWVRDGHAAPPDRPGLGVAVSMEKIGRYQVGEAHVG